MTKGTIKTLYCMMLIWGAQYSVTIDGRIWNKIGRYKTDVYYGNEIKEYVVDKK